MNNEQMGAHVQAQLTKAQQLQAAGRRSEAVAVLRQMLTLQANGTFWGNVAQMLLQAADLDSALVAARKFVTTCPDNVQAKSLLANVLGDVGQLDEAVSLATKVAKHFSQVPLAHYSLGVLLSKAGRIKTARDSFSKSVSLDPDNALALEYLAYLDNGESTEKLLEQINAAFGHHGRGDPSGNAALHYSRATLLERQEKWDDAFDAYEAGAQLMKGNARLDLSAMERYIGRLKQTFSASFFEKNTARRHDNARPVFIVGMPRSGTTLVESVLASHSKVSAGGETALLGIATMPFGSFEPQDIARINDEIAAGQKPWSTMGQALQQLHNDRHGTRGRVTEKNLGHHLLLGVISMIAAGAQVIYCKRDPVATAWSCYKTRFMRGNGWSYDFPSIARYQQLYARTMAHWQNVLPGAPILELEYEDLVSKPSEIIPQILAHAGLTFEAACLSPHKSGMAVSTASLTQVRQPIHTSANLAWERYESRLAPYLDELRR